MTSVLERQLRANDEEPKVQPEPLITSHHQPELKLAPNLPPPVLLVFRGFIAESAAGQMDSNWYPTSIPARLKASAGFVRSVDFHTAGLQTLVGIRPARSDLGEQPGALNGVIQVSRSPLAKLQRDLYAKLVPRPVSDFEYISWLKPPPYVQQIYVQTSAPDRIWPASLAEPVLQTYLDQQLARCHNIGKEGPHSDFAFAREWVDSTRNWPLFWLNDRSVPRRPWIHIERSGPDCSGNAQVNFVDGILHDHPPAPHNRFHCRKLDVEYAVLVDAELQKEKELHAIVHGESEKLPEPINKAKHALVVQKLLDASRPPLQLTQSRDWTGTKLPTAAVKHFMFGFGSLMNTASRTSSDPSAIAAVPVRVSAAAGFARCWNFQHPTAAITALGVKRCAKGEGQPINGVCTPIYTDGMGQPGASDDGAESEEVRLPQAVLDREVGYTPYAIPAELCHPLGWATLPRGAKVWLFVPNSPEEGGAPGTGLKSASHSHPILQTYVDICILGCLEYSREFAIEFVTTTQGWDGPWLNDREVPRRPWVHQPKWRQVDSILREVIREDYESRMLPTEFGANLIALKRGDTGHASVVPTKGQWYGTQSPWAPWTKERQAEAESEEDFQFMKNAYHAWKAAHAASITDEAFQDAAATCKSPERCRHPANGTKEAAAAGVSKSATKSILDHTLDY